MQTNNRNLMVKTGVGIHFVVVTFRHFRQFKTPCVQKIETVPKVGNLVS